MKQKTILFIFSAFLAGCLFSFMLLSSYNSHRKTVSTPLTKKTDDTKVGSIFLYFSDREEIYLKSEKRILQKNKSPEELAVKIIKLLIDGPEKNHVKTLPKGTKLNALYILKDGTACIDFSDELKNNHPGGSQTEYLTIFSIVNSLILNIPEIRRVKLLIGNQEATTLAGHIDLRFPLKANMLLIR